MFHAPQRLVVLIIGPRPLFLVPSALLYAPLPFGPPQTTSQATWQTVGGG